MARHNRNCHAQVEGMKASRILHGTEPSTSLTCVLHPSTSHYTALPCPQTQNRQQCPCAVTTQHTRQHNTTQQTFSFSVLGQLKPSTRHNCTDLVLPTVHAYSIHTSKTPGNVRSRVSAQCVQCRVQIIAGTPLVSCGKVRTSVFSAAMQGPKLHGSAVAPRQQRLPTCRAAGATATHTTTVSRECRPLEAGAVHAVQGRWPHRKPA
jgi:hypothetical protein